MIDNKKVPFQRKDFTIQCVNVDSADFIAHEVIMGIMIHKHEEEPVKIVQWMGFCSNGTLVSFGLLKEYPTVETLGFFNEVWRFGHGTDSNHYWAHWEQTGEELKIGKDRFFNLFALDRD